jgi:hypothetical protein
VDTTFHTCRTVSLSAVPWPCTRATEVVTLPRTAYAGPRTGKSNVIGQPIGALERREGERTIHIDVWAPTAVDWLLTLIKQTKPEQRVAFKQVTSAFSGPIIQSKRQGPLLVLCCRARREATATKLLA